MKILIDTNVPLVANKKSEQASVACVLNCIRRLQQALESDVLVLDDGWHILGEYQHKLHSSGQPGPGDAFLKWVLTNRSNPARCDLSVCIHSVGDPAQPREFEEFPEDPELTGFDASDHKFVAVACAHPEHPPVLNAVDSDWWDYREALKRNGVRVEFICPDADFMM